MGSLYARKDLLIKPDYNFLYKIVSVGYPEELNNTVESDDNNIFKYLGHFRVIFGKDYNNSVLTNDLADKILKIANYVWDKEIEEFGFKQPRNTNKYYVDIYIGNKSAYNPERGYVNISDDLCGYATAYSDGTPYFVLNPDKDENILKVTVAHEFFHTIQYAYGLDRVDYDIWNKNIWFLEASAVMMEDEVYDDVNDYLNYLPYYLNYTNYPIDYYNGGIEYGKVLFAKYIKEKYGMEKIKKIFEDYETNETILDDLKKEFNFNKLMLNYAKCLVNEHTCFEEGKFYPDIRFYTQTHLNNIGYYGILFLNEGNSSYLSSLNNQYLQEDFNGTLNRIININKDGLILINKQNNIMNSDIINNNNYDGFKIKKGWNLISNCFYDDIDLSKLYGVIFWVYRDGIYKAYSGIDAYKKAIKELNLSMKSSAIYKNEGFWVYSDKNITIKMKKINISDNNLTLKEGWQIVGFSSAFEPKYLYSSIIWNYDNNKGWSYYSNIDLNYSKINIIKPLKGYFVKKY